MRRLQAEISRVELVANFSNMARFSKKLVTTGDWIGQLVTAGHRVPIPKEGP
ncbi:hypothetical protein ACQEVY_21075 [Streptomyces sp. CA-288835]|uniref:hypothetical protein n=1 Tax=Streptomyces sp. CA-288835 TaxID=3240069 RepID=UPI003D8CCBFA